MPHKIALPFVLTTLIFSAVAVCPVQIGVAQQPPNKGVGVRTPITQLPSKNKRFALIIGIDDYDSRQINRLSGAVGDARALAEALVQYAGFPREQVIVLTTAEPRERQPRRSTILQYLSNLRGLVPADGLLLVAFSGHGIERQGKPFLLPSDVIATEDVSLLEDTAISMERMRSLIRTTGVGQVMLILDACRNDPSAGKGDAANLMTEAMRRGFDFGARNQGVEAFVTLYSTAVGDRAYEYSEKGQGNFSWALVEGLKGAAANAKGEITLGGLKSYIERTVPFKVQLELGKKQRPFSIVEGYQAEELVLALVEAPAVVTNPITPPSPNPTAGNTTPPRPRVRMSVAGVSLAAMSFVTARVDASGSVTNQQQAQCYGFIEDLGNGVKLPMVEIPGRTFQMGLTSSAAQEAGEDAKRYIPKDAGYEWFADEQPQHQVSVSGFAMGRYEVTQAQWQAIMGNNPAKFKGDMNLPVEEVSWEEAQEFCRKLSARTGRSYRLPTEAEWEYAARAGTTTAFAFGDTISTQIVNYNGNYPYKQVAKGSYRGKTVAVGSLGAANGFGLYDMHGNVWEWCEDVWHESYHGAPSDGASWLSGGDSSYRVLRGGSWYNIGNECRAASRNWNGPGVRSSILGFRVVASARTQ